GDNTDRVELGGTPDRKTFVGELVRDSPNPPMKWDGYPNLRKRPPTPAKARGSIQRAIRRAFAASGAEALTSAQIYDWAYVRRRLGRCKTLPAGVYSRALRTLKV